MSLKAIIERIGKFFDKYVYNPNYRCLNCGVEIFDNKRFCSKCLEELPYNDKYICEHCGRQVLAPENYCSTCKGKLTAIDKCRSFFVYDKPISNLIQGFKYSNRRYLVDYFTDCLKKIYLINCFNADFFVYVPMTKKAQRKRGYNQSKLLAEALSKKVNVPVIECLEKVKETKRQATLNRKERLLNLDHAFKVTNKKVVKNKTIVIIDDVTTTGATCNVVADILKRAGAKSVYLLTVASTPPIDKY